MSDTHDMTEHNAASVADTPLRVLTGIVDQSQNSVSNIPIVKPVRKRLDGYDNLIAKVRDVTPAALVNNGSRLCLGFKASADGFSIWSGLVKNRKSPWRVVASSISLFGEFLGVYYPEKKISVEREDKYAHQSKFEYAIAKTKEALNPRENVTETVGLTLIANGLCMAMSGRAQSSAKEKSWEIAQGLMTSAAGGIMTYMTDRERAWQFAHATFMARSVPAALQAHKAYYVGYPNAKEPVAPGDWQQGVKWGLNQIANVLGTLYGGVKKMPDGSIEHLGKNGVEFTAPKQSRRQVQSKYTDAERKHVMQHGHLPGSTPDVSVSQTAQMGKVADADTVVRTQVGAV